MLSFIERVYRRIKRLLIKNAHAGNYDFNVSNPLGGNGERVDIQMNGKINFNSLDTYQKSHWRRYEFAKKKIGKGDVCGDFACGTGYGSILLSEKAKTVTGADLNNQVITAIKERYIQHEQVSFFTEDLLNLTFTDHFNSIVSFETLEHFDELNLRKLLSIFSKALKKNGRLILSTPYMQEQSELAIKMGFHLTFYINEERLKNWLEEAGLKIEVIKYQNYETHDIAGKLNKKDFIICVAGKQMINA